MLSSSANRYFAPSRDATFHDENGRHISSDKIDRAYFTSPSFTVEEEATIRNRKEELYSRGIFFDEEILTMYARIESPYDTYRRREDHNRHILAIAKSNPGM